ncbi:MAG: hypothetical protein SGI77_23660 [Pirellulaceae bacterium]|nr:hypothetical protein [Pirellulaceae bacterium]
MKNDLILILVSVLFFCFQSCRAAEFPFDIAISGEGGSYDVKRWKVDWPGCNFEDGVAEGHASVVHHSNRNWLRVKCSPNQIGPEKGGVGWRWPLEGRERIELSYTLQFADDFEFVKGGKLPGLSGGPKSVTGGNPADGKNGFSARIMWRKEGRGEAYVYHMDQPDKYGQSFSFPDDFRFPRGEPIEITLRVGMNRLDQADGSIQVWVRRCDDAASMKVVDRNNVRWRTDKTILVDSLLCEVFHGGNDLSWAPQQTCSIDFTAFRVAIFE